MNMYICINYMCMLYVFIIYTEVLQWFLAKIFLKLYFKLFLKSLILNLTRWFNGELLLFTHVYVCLRVEID